LKRGSQGGRSATGSKVKRPEMCVGKGGIGREVHLCATGSTGMYSYKKKVPLRGGVVDVIVKKRI